MDSMRFTTLAAMVCLAMGLLPGHASAEERAVQAPAPTAPAAPSVPSTGSRVAWELEIEDGALLHRDGKKVPADLQSVISYLRDFYPANIVLAPGLSQIPLQDLKLTTFDWEQALEALKVASGDAFTWRRRAPGQSGSHGSEVDPTTGMVIVMPSLPAPRTSEDLYVLTPNPDAAPRSKRSVEVFNLANYLRGNDPAKALTDIETILADTLRELDENQAGSPPRLQFHRSAGLLIVMGSPDQISVARQIIMALPEVSSSAASPAAQGVPPTSASDAANREALMRRYGIVGGIAPQPVVPPPQPTAPAPPRRH